MRHLERTEHVVEEALVHVHGDQLEEVLVQQGEHLGVVRGGGGESGGGGVEG